MRVIVLGAGVVGVTTAYFLAAKGARVTVIDRAHDVAEGASYANGGQLSYSFTDSLAKPAFLARLPALLLGMHPGTRIRPSPALLAWGLRFLRQCTSGRAEHNTLELLGIAMRSAKLLSMLRRDLGIDFSYRPAGKLVLLANDAELEAAQRTTKIKNAHGCDAEVLTRQQAMDVEPALAALAQPFVAAVYSASDEVADARRFTTGLRDYLERMGRVEFLLGTEAERLVVRRGRVRGVDALSADAVVVCLGAWSERLLRTAGLRSRIYPVRGYSVTLPPGSAPPSVSVTSLSNGIVFSRLNGSMRIAGFADFDGFESRDDAGRIRTLLDTAASVAPAAADYDHAPPQAWGGFRPMTPSGRPLVGQSAVGGLYLNTGHGMLGWTLACATAHDVALELMRTNRFD